MEIKEEVIEVLTTTQVEILNTSGDYGNYFKTLLDNEEAEVLAEKLIPIFDKEKKEFALEMLNEFTQTIISHCSFSNGLTLKDKQYLQSKFPSQLTATKLEGEK